ncbi:hypothetical protein ACUTAF_09170 [Pseudomonas sp. SP16.1]|uniref:hypothetical protein n=1 Tax=Pseudomonas sp. SP16.1 TaxID=3458854 RepID=UPI004045ACC0
MRTKFRKKFRRRSIPARSSNRLLLEIGKRWPGNRSICFPALLFALEATASFKEVLKKPFIVTSAKAGDQGLRRFWIIPLRASASAVQR